ncbi:MAG: lactate racemase domain-containing protein [Verrucomicrobiota bacterium]|jgi:nickel-dependent lactate racemase|nr:lactate racemase domain-containing protein [Verrucomicrobiota bacterium]
MSVLSQTATSDHSLGDECVSKLVGDALPIEEYRGQKILLIVPDHTRTAPVGLLFKSTYRQIGEATAALDVMIALGTHPPMNEEAICERLEISLAERRNQYAKVQFHNHEWDNPNALKEIGVIPASDIAELSGGRFEMELPVKINRRLFNYDQVIIVGPVFPHEVVGFSGGNKYLFPGVSGPELLNFFHWLGAVISNPKIIGHKWTAVRKVVDRASAMVAVDKRCFAMVVRPDKSLAGLFFGTPESAWDAAANLSDKVHIIYKNQPFHTILSCAPPMYDDIWVGGKCMYKLEPVLADGGELIIYGPHIKSISHTHEAGLREVGYHCSSWLLEHWEKYKNHPWGLLAHSSHVKGIGQVVNGMEKPRANVTLATGLSEAVCGEINLGYRDPASINIEDYANREDEGVLLVRRAGEMLHRLNNSPAWALP